MDQLNTVPPPSYPERSPPELYEYESLGYFLTWVLRTVSKIFRFTFNREMGLDACSSGASLDVLEISNSNMKSNMSFKGLQGGPRTLSKLIKICSKMGGQEGSKFLVIKSQIPHLGQGPWKALAT